MVIMKSIARALNTNQKYVPAIISSTHRPLLQNNATMKVQALSGMFNWSVLMGVSLVEQLIHRLTSPL